jgi:tight adherence protein C
MQLVRSLLFASAAGLLTHQSGRLLIRRTSEPRATITGRRRSALVTATGTVLGTEAELHRLVVQRMIAVAVAAALAAVVVWWRADIAGISIAALLFLGAWQLPLIFARRRETARRAAVDLEMTDALGEMVMSVEAGLALALKEMVDRTPTSAMQLFVAAIRQNQRIGAPLATVLRQQASTARRRRRQDVEERSTKLAMKMVFPTVLCILPALMIVVVGPAIIRTLQSLG